LPTVQCQQATSVVERALHRQRVANRQIAVADGYAAIAEIAE
jgi:hypothetical protein